MQFQRATPERPATARGPTPAVSSRRALPAAARGALNAPGQQLEPTIRSYFEERFGHDFSRVRIHADEAAGRSASVLNALAYTVGEHVVFGSCQYAPHTSAGGFLLAHELAHVVQQRNGG